MVVAFLYPKLAEWGLVLYLAPLPYKIHIYIYIGREAIEKALKRGGKRRRERGGGAREKKRRKEGKLPGETESQCHSNCITLVSVFPPNSAANKKI